MFHITRTFYHILASFTNENGLGEKRFLLDPSSIPRKYGSYYQNSSEAQGTK